MVKATQKWGSAVNLKPANERERKRKLDDSLPEEASSISPSKKNAEGKKGKTEPKANVDSDLGVVDTNILQQAGVNLGLPLADNEDSISETVVKEKKKKKKKAEKLDSPAPSDKSKRTIDYLKLWQSNRKQWKFNKMLQVHLFNIMYNESLLLDQDFEILLLYLEGLKGKSKEQTKIEAEKIINSDKKEDDSSDSSKEERARQIIQILS